MPRVLQLLELYRTEAPSKIQLERLDPYPDPAGFEEAARRSPDLAINPRGGALVIEYGEGDSADRVVIRSADLFDVRDLDPSGPRRDAVGSLFQGEDAVTSALIRLMDGEKPSILFSAGHGEPSIRQVDPGQPGLGMLAARLSALGARVAEMPPGFTEIPPGTSLVIIGGPQAVWPVEEIGRLREYANRGGKVIVFLDNQAPTNLDGWLREHNVTLGAGVVVDLRYNDEGRPSIAAVPIGPEDRHPIVASLANRAILMASATPLVALRPSPGSAGAEPGNPAMVAVPFLRSSPGSWAETMPDVRPLARDDGRDMPGPMDLAVAVSDRSRKSGDAPTPRLVVFGSRFVADNAFVSRDPANLDLIINAVQWLRDRPDLQGIAPKTQLALSLDADPALRTKLVLIPTLIAVTILGALGVLVFLLRRE